VAAEKSQRKKRLSDDWEVLKENQDQDLRYLLMVEPRSRKRKANFAKRVTYPEEQKRKGKWRESRQRTPKTVQQPPPECGPGAGPIRPARRENKDKLKEKRPTHQKGVGNQENFF